MNGDYLYLCPIQFQNNYQFISLSLKQVMDNCEQSRKRLAKTLDYVLQAVKEKCGRFVASVFERAADISENTIKQIEETLYQFGDHSKRYFQKNTALLLDRFSPQSVDNRKKRVWLNDAELFVLEATSRSLEFLQQDFKQFAFSIFKQIPFKQFDYALQLVKKSLNQLRKETAANALKAIRVNVFETLQTQCSNRIDSKLDYFGGQLINRTVENQMQEQSSSEQNQSQITLFGKQQFSSYPSKMILINNKETQSDLIALSSQSKLQQQREGINQFLECIFNQLKQGLDMPLRNNLQINELAQDIRLDLTINIAQNNLNPFQSEKLSKKKIREAQIQRNKFEIENGLIRAIASIEGEATQQFDNEFINERENADGIESQSVENKLQQQIIEFSYNIFTDFINTFQQPHFQEKQKSLKQLRQKIDHLEKQFDQFFKKRQMHIQQQSSQQKYKYLQIYQQNWNQLNRIRKKIEFMEKKTPNAAFPQLQLIMKFVSQIRANIQLIDERQTNSDKLRRKKEKKKESFIRALKLRMTEEQRLNMLRYQHYKQILQIRQMYKKIKIYLFKEEFQILWLFKLDQEIQDKVKELDDSQLIKLISQWREQLQRRSNKIDQFCFKHKSRVFYLCLNQMQKERVYLCNKCMEDKQQISSHQNHEINCKRHRKSIKYALPPCKKSVHQSIPQDIIDKQERKKKQKYLCQQCINNHYKQYTFVSNCHYQAVAQLCLQEECIKEDKFIVCPNCNTHKDHRRVIFNKNSLMKQLHFENEIDITKYQQQYTKVEEMLRLDALQKVLNAYAEQICQTLRFLKSFKVHSDKQLQKWVDFFMNGGRREELIVLRGVLIMKEIKYSQTDRSNYLEAFSILMEEELQGMFKDISERVSKCCRKIEELGNMEEGEVNIVLNQRYAQIIDIQTEDKVTVLPMRLSQVNSIHYDRIQKITVRKQREEQSDQRIERERREAMRRFFTQEIGTKLNQAEIGKEQQTQIIQIFIEAEQWGNQLQIDLDKLGELSEHRSLIQSINQSFTKMNTQFQAKQRECLVFTQITLNKFTNLKAIQIQYHPRYQIYDVFYYSISAFALFKFIGANPQLEEVTIQAVNVEEMDQFLWLLNPNNKDLQIYYESKEGELSWMKIFRPQKLLKLTINTNIEFNFSKQNKDQTLSQKKDGIYFFGLFGCLSGITVWFGGLRDNEIGDWENVLNELLLSLRGIKNIKIGIQHCYDSSLKWLLFALSSFTEITSLTFNWIKLSSQFAVGDLAALFNNNKLTHLGLHWCSNFPALPPITTLQSIDLINVKFREEFGLNQFIKANKLLRSIQCHQMEQKCVIDEQLFNQLQDLSIWHCDGASFENVSFKPPSSLKYLTILRSKISAESLKAVFPKLDKLTHLSLWDIHFGYSLLSLIPSPHLEELSIQWNDEIMDKCLQLIDSKWPYLRRIELGHCSKVTEKFLSLCKFKSLIEIKWNGLSTQARRYLRKRGIIN